MKIKMIAVALSIGLSCGLGAAEMKVERLGEDLWRVYNMGSDLIVSCRAVAGVAKTRCKQCLYRHGLESDLQRAAVYAFRLYL